ncbi:MAG: hypothetical protein U0Z44_06770 [Kouleothrix sp.]
MAQFVGAGMSNDALANLAAALCWACIRALRRGPGWRLVLATVALLGLGRLPSARLRPGCCCSRRWGWAWRQARHAAGLALACGAGGAAAGHAGRRRPGAGRRDPLAADGWYRPAPAWRRRACWAAGHGGTSAGGRPATCHPGAAAAGKLVGAELRPALRRGSVGRQCWARGGG